MNLKEFARRVSLKGFDALMARVPLRYRVPFLQYGSQRAQQLANRVRAFSIVWKTPDSGHSVGDNEASYDSSASLDRQTSVVGRLSFSGYRFLSKVSSKLQHEAARDDALWRLGRRGVERERKLLKIGQQGDIEYCRRTYERYIEAGEHEYLPSLASFYLKWGEIGHSFRALNTYYQLGEQASIGGRLEAAATLLRLRTIEIALSFDPASQVGNVSTWGQLQELFQNARLSEMARGICDGILLRTLSGAALLLRAEANYLDGRDKEAVADFERCVALVPLTAKTYKLWYNVLYRMGDRDGALRVITMAEQEFPDLFLSFRLGRLLMERQDYSQGKRRLTDLARAASRAYVHG